MALDSSDAPSRCLTIVVAIDRARHRRPLEKQERADNSGAADLSDKEVGCLRYGCGSSVATSIIAAIPLLRMSGGSAIASASSAYHLLRRLFVPLMDPI